MKFQDKINRGSPVRTSAHLILWTSFICFFLFIIWAKFAVLPEVTVATATVIPVTHVLTIQNMEGGIIKKILVHEGEVVQKDQVIAYLDPTRFLSALDEARARADALQIKIARLTAETDHQPFQIPPDIANTTNPSLQSQIKAEQELLQLHQDQLQKMQQNISLSEQELKMTKPLVSKGAASAVEIMHLERQMLDLKDQMDQFHIKQLDELATAKGDLASLKAATVAIQDRLDRTTIRSTMKGVIKQIRIANAESVVPPSAEIMTIVPLENKLLIEAQVKPSNIGFIHAGQPVTVKITAYDYSIYGGLEGSVNEVSADTVTDAKGHTYYIVRVKTNKNYLGTDKKPLYIIPGMTATVSILTGKKTVFDYLMSPVLKITENAFHER